MTRPIAADNANPKIGGTELTTYLFFSSLFSSSGCGFWPLPFALLDPATPAPEPAAACVPDAKLDARDRDTRAGADADDDGAAVGVDEEDEDEAVDEEAVPLVAIML